MRRLARLLLFAVFAAAIASPALSAATGEAGPRHPFTAAPVADPASDRSFLQRAAAFVQHQQSSLYRQLAGALRAIQSGPPVATAATLIFLSFAYGVFHAAGPGHGKAVISAYLLANERAVKRGVGLSFAASLAQAATAILLVSAIVFALNGFGITTKQSIGPLTMASAAMIAAIGAWMLWSSLRALGSRRARTDNVHATDHSGSAACHHGASADPDLVSGRLSWAKAGSVVAAIGLRPCSGAIFVLLFANTIGLYMAGVWSTLAMALGTAITVSLLAALTLWSKQAAVRLAGLRTRGIEHAYRALSLIGSFGVLCLGLLLLFAASGTRTPFPVP